LTTSHDWTVNVGSNSMFVCFTGKSGNNKYVEEWSIINPNKVRLMKRIDLNNFGLDFFQTYVSAKSDYTDFFYILGYSIANK